MPSLNVDAVAGRTTVILDDNDLDRIRDGHELTLHTLAADVIVLVSARDYPTARA